MMLLGKGLKFIPKALRGAGSVSEQVLVFVTGSYYNVPWSGSLY